ncbi:unnamed protein product [Prorocentrum cordatum]|uniref:Uncharacterized protein n=1 Tax=Prorocentrum cordatum TaxID=2364126 RepID=A0ABN9W080_9DINO|nr:unnamed protein product [Polarella glacialis]
MPAVGCLAAPEAAEQPSNGGGSLWPARRVRQAAARLAAAGRQSAALERVKALESRASELEADFRKTLEVHEAAAQQAVALAGTDATGEADKLRGELVGRLAVETPILAAGLAAGQGSVVVPCVPTLGKQRRDTAARVFNAAAMVIQEAGKAELDCIQRGARHRLQRSARLGRRGGGQLRRARGAEVRDGARLPLRRPAGAGLHPGGQQPSARRPPTVTAAPVRRVPSARRGCPPS